MVWLTKTRKAPTEEFDFEKLLARMPRRKPRYTPAPHERALRKGLVRAKRQQARANAIQNGLGARGSQRLT